MNDADSTDWLLLDLAEREASRGSVAALERIVVGSLVLDVSTMPLVLDEVRGEDFGTPVLGEVFEALVAMAARREPVDVVSVSEVAPRWGIRGFDPSDVHRWVSEVSNVSGVGWYARRVREAAIRREVRGEAIRLARAASSSEPVAALSSAIDNLRDLLADRRTDPVRARALRDVLAGEDFYDWVVEGILERGDRLVVTGAEGGGKSTLLRQIAILSAAGIHPFSFAPIRPARVLVVDAENSERMWRRQSRRVAERAERFGSGDSGGLALACVRRMNVTTDRDLAVVHRLVDEARPDLVLIGPLYRLVPRAITNDDDAAPVLAALDTIRDRGVALVLEAHAGHATGIGGERDYRPRGSAALLGWPEFGFGMRPRAATLANMRDEVDLVRWRGDRDERAWPRRLARGGDWPWIPTMVT